MQLMSKYFVNFRPGSVFCRLLILMFRKLWEFQQISIMPCLNLTGHVCCDRNVCCLQNGQHFSTNSSMLLAELLFAKFDSMVYAWLISSGFSFLCFLISFICLAILSSSPSSYYALRTDQTYSPINRTVIFLPTI